MRDLCEKEIAPYAGARLWRNLLHASGDGNLRAGFFLDILEHGFSPQDAQQQLDTAIGWGRYAELFDYDVHTGQITAGAAAAPAATVIDGVDRS